VLRRRIAHFVDATSGRVLNAAPLGRLETFEKARARQVLARRELLRALRAADPGTPTRLALDRVVAHFRDKLLPLPGSREPQSTRSGGE
jgi:hypothetical protein